MGEVTKKRFIVVLVLLLIAIIGDIVGLYLLVKIIKYRNYIALLEDPSRDWAELRYYEEKNKRLEAIQPGQKRIVFLGASITEMWDLKNYFPEFKHIVNRGRNGQYAWQELLRFKQDVVDIGADIVVIKICAVNMRKQIPLKITKDYMEMMVRLALSYKITPVVATTLPVAKDFEKKEERNEGISFRIIEFNNWLKSFAKSLSIPIIDYHQALSNTDGYFKDPSLTTDGLHPSEKGYKIMSEVAKPILVRLLE